ncbi:MAG: hypothetical protein KA076_09015 [Candidatus Marinimicrobia bacterium]|jgi:hypothetical protein|nr:hypothetical protein [Candidatus Neomarinimicrobiota bacterium]OQC43731.1 MAG: hypothetical protein BWX60_00915 [Candidatus Marinimicrobia bacterium ADurb.Bin030]HNZ36353.1 hypothetical protein [Candidatus Neomarinimicrobiota bacterium]HOG75402.1 hypothetical protein [Candidatus Neomarinimicrobiota bacterium]HOV23829.1 hypothetical protein [Candidatus Neomarinimicrobiota bacterium]
MKQDEQQNDKRTLLFLRRLIQNVIGFLQRNYKLLITWAIIIIAVIVGIHFRVDKGIIVVLVMIFGLFAEAFSGLIALLATVPVIGPIVAKVLTLPIFWIFNALGYFVSLVAIKRGYKKEVINYRFVTMVFLTGFAVGFIIAKLL